MGFTPSLRDARQGDVPAILDIFTHYVLNSTSTFAEVPPTVEEYREKLVSIHALNLPFLVAVVAGGMSGEDLIIGYTYASPFKPSSSGYRYALETSVYIAPGYTKRGLGSLLLRALIDACEGQGPWRTLVAVIGDAPEAESDEGRSSNRASIALHEKLGFQKAGRLRSMGWKQGKWLDVVYMQRTLHPKLRGEGDPP